MRDDMSDTKTLSLADIEAPAFAALVAPGTSEANAHPLALATAATEADGMASNGLASISEYCDHVGCGKVDGIDGPVGRIRGNWCRVSVASHSGRAVRWAAWLTCLALPTHPHGPPRTGRFFIANDPKIAASDVFMARMSDLVQANCSQGDTHLPGDERRKGDQVHKEGV